MDITQFQCYLLHEKRYSAHTIRVYISDLEQLELYLATNYATVQIEKITFDIVRSFLVSLMEKGLKARTINRKLSTLRTFYHYLLREGVIALNPLTHIPNVKTPESIPEFMTEPAMKMLIEEYEWDWEQFSMYRDYLMLQMFYSTGIRVSELCAIQVEHISFAKNELKVLGKRNKMRLVPLSTVLVEHMKRYLVLKEREQSKKESQNCFFITDHGTPVYSRFVYRKVHHYLSFVTTRQKRSPHVLRHTFATHLLGAGADINAIKEILGHASLAATQVYTHTSIEQLKKTYKRTHPGINSNK